MKEYLIVILCVDKEDELNESEHFYPIKANTPQEAVDSREVELLMEDLVSYYIVDEVFCDGEIIPLGTPYPTRVKLSLKK